MKPLNILLSLGLLLPVLAEAQVSPATQPATTTSQSTTLNATSRPSVRPPATRAASPDATTPSTSTGSKPNRKQELYDQYHGITKKPTPPPPAPVTPVVVASEPAPKAEAPEPTPAMTSAPEETQVANTNANFRIGIRGGVTYPVYLEKVAGSDPAISFVGGLVMQFGRGKFSFQPEINYSRITQKLSSSGFGAVESKYAVDQVVVPLLFKISTGTFEGNRFFVNVGPYGAYLASTSINGLKREVPSNVGRFSFGAAVGVGAMLKAGPGHVTIEARGLYNLGNSTDGIVTDSKTIIAEGTLGYVFPLGGR
ncbi:porin family protein [Spirosoma endbachense]|uniref:Outer membrane beta-barrel protein n=1 Tax=Spirosoma endbachense TaxID=2666025 RepID=A0A6P1W214_9BACT|nr:porin family protein [Spirosoma endbachense]QHV99453.1 outer membrane beta-barrel protein [Spirosoma endbachense]